MGFVKLNLGRTGMDAVTAWRVLAIFGKMLLVLVWSWRNLVGFGRILSRVGQILPGLVMFGLDLVQILPDLVQILPELARFGFKERCYRVPRSALMWDPPRSP